MFWYIYYLKCFDRCFGMNKESTIKHHTNII